jgi:hypothetical protein
MYNSHTGKKEKSKRKKRTETNRQTDRWREKEGEECALSLFSVVAL